MKCYLNRYIDVSCVWELTELLNVWVYTLCKFGLQLHVCEAIPSSSPILFSFMFIMLVSFILDGFHCRIFKLTNLFFCKSSLQLIPFPVLLKHH